MLIYIIAFISFIFLIIGARWLYKKYGKKNVENFWDIVPYDLTSNIYKCKNMDCIKDESYKCYKWCNNWPEPGGQNNCRKSCLDHADIMTIQDRFNGYTFGDTKSKFDEFSLLVDNESF